MAVKAPQNDHFPIGFIRVSASGAKGWEMIDFTQVLPRFWNALWVLLTKMAWRTFNLDHVLVGVQRFSVNAFFVKSPPRKIQFGPRI